MSAIEERRVNAMFVKLASITGQMEAMFQLIDGLDVDAVTTKVQALADALDDTQAKLDRLDTSVTLLEYKMASVESRLDRLANPGVHVHNHNVGSANDVSIAPERSSA